MKNECGVVDNHAVYVLHGVDYEGFKEVLGPYISPAESKSTWMKIIDSIKARGVEDILFLSMDGVSGLEARVRSIFPQTVIQRCIVHFTRNATKYIPSKYLKEFCADYPRAEKSGRTILTMYVSFIIILSTYVK